jgi:hypothetical protein
MISLSSYLFLKNFQNDLDIIKDSLEGVVTKTDLDKSLADIVKKSDLETVVTSIVTKLLEFVVPLLI